MASHKKQRSRLGCTWLGGCCKNYMCHICCNEIMQVTHKIYEWLDTVSFKKTSMCVEKGKGAEDYTLLQDNIAEK